MAENKKGFVLYADIYTTIKKLPIEKAGELFLLILAYVNDEDPKTDDLLLDIAFDPIKNQLKRDLKRWESKQDQRIAAGRRSAEIRRVNAQQNERPLTTVEKNEHPSTVNGNVIGNVIGNGSVKDTVINKDKYMSSDKQNDHSIIDYNALIKLYHEKCPKMPCVKVISASRKKAIKARVKEYGKETVLEVLTKAGKSGFHNGDNDRNWTATFDWIFNASNFVKIMERQDINMFDRKTDPTARMIDEVRKQINEKNKR